MRLSSFSSVFATITISLSVTLPYSQSAYAQTTKKPSPMPEGATVISLPDAGPVFQFQQDLVISVPAQSTPLREAAKRISRAFGVPISYEDEKWSWIGDLMPWADTPQAAKNPSARLPTDADFRVPAFASLESRVLVDWRQDALVSTGTVLKNVVEEHIKRGNPGKFKIVNLGESGFSIVPTEVRNGSGVFVAVQSPLDARISFPVEERKVIDALVLIGNLVSQASGERIVVNTTAAGAMIPPFENGVTGIGAQNETARDVLSKVLRTMVYGTYDIGPPKFSWTLRYENVSGAYHLSFNAVTRDLISGGLGVIHGLDDNPQEIVRWPANTASTKH